MVHVRAARVVEPGGMVWEFSDRPAPADVERVVEDVAGWYGGSGVRAESTARLQHGDFPERGWRESRSMTLHGASVCRDSDARDVEERRLSGFLWDGRFGDMTCDDGDAVLSTRVRLDGEPQIVKIGTTGLRFQIPLRAETPWLYGEERTVFLRPIGAGIGLEYPLGGQVVNPTGEPVLSYGSGVDSQDPINNNGNADAWPVFVVVGEFASGFTITVGDRVVSWPWPTTRTAPVEVDMRGQVRVAGMDQSHRAGFRQWTPVPAGSTVQPVFEPIQDGSGWCEVRIRDTYI